MTQTRQMPPWKAAAGCGDFVGMRAMSQSDIDSSRTGPTPARPKGDAADLPARATFDGGWALGTARPRPQRCRKRSRRRPTRRVPLLLHPRRCDEGDAGGDGRLPSRRPRDGASHRAVPRHHRRQREARQERRRLPMLRRTGPRYRDAARRLDAGRAAGAAPRGNGGAHSERRARGDAGSLSPALRPGGSRSDADRAVSHARPGARSRCTTTSWPTRISSSAPATPTRRWRPSAARTTTSTIVSVYPHMHLLGTKIKVEAKLADGTTACMIDVPQYDFNWQGQYVYTTPLHLARGGRSTSNRTSTTRPTTGTTRTRRPKTCAGAKRRPTRCAWR